MAKSNHIRSISFPSRSHPSIQKVEEELTKLKTIQVSVTPEAATISSVLLGLEQMYKCMDDLLNLPQTLQTLSQNQNQKWVDGLLEKSVRLLDICSLARDCISQLKEHLRDLQSSQRRRKEDSSTEASITRYTSFIKKMNKDAKKSIAAIKKIDNEIDGLTPLDVHHDISAVIKALREATTVSLSIFQFVLVFLSVPVLKPKPSRWSLVSKLVQSGRVACEYQHDNTCNLETLEAQLEAIENQMESIFRDKPCTLSSGEVAKNDDVPGSKTTNEMFINTKIVDEDYNFVLAKVEGRSTPLDVHHEISAVIRALREASAVSLSIFQLVLLFLSMPVLKPKPSKWSVVSKLVQNGRVACEYQHNSTCNLETLEAQLEDIENKMEIIFRSLIKLRSSLLNIISC
nr:uncharacterized protein LOC109167532 [Ipomoea trifida]